MEKCLDCNATVRREVTEASVLAGGELKRMLLNPDADPAGNVVYTLPDAEGGPVRVLTKEALAAPPTRLRYMPHNATCVWARRRTRGMTPAARDRALRRFEEETAARERPPRGRDD
jgi:hypothetical protein